MSKEEARKQKQAYIAGYREGYMAACNESEYTLDPEVIEAFRVAAAKVAARKAANWDGFWDGLCYGLFAQ